MPVFTPQQFSRSQSVDLETACALALIRWIDQPYPAPGGGPAQIKLAQVFEDWATFQDNFVSPGAVVEPDGELLYGPGQTEPRLMEETWEPQGGVGFGLYVLSEATKDFTLTVRSSNQAERNALKAGIEAAFVDPAVLLAPPLGARYGVVVQVPEYWDLPFTLKLLGSRKPDDAQKAAANIWDAEFRVAVQARHVKLGPVRPFVCRLTEKVGDEVVVTPGDPLE